jgi:hypothetical protein
MPSGTYPQKDPSDRLDYTVDFTQVLETTEQLTSAVWTITGAGAPALGTQEIIAAGKMARVWVLAGGTVNVDYILELTATSNLGSPGPRIWQRQLVLPMRGL